jgi:hypothetical protein
VTKTLTLESPSLHLKPSFVALARRRLARILPPR